MRKTFIAAALAAVAAGVAAEPATFAIDPGHSVVTFEVLHLNTSTHRAARPGQGGQHRPRPRRQDRQGRHHDRPDDAERGVLGAGRLAEGRAGVQHRAEPDRAFRRRHLHLRRRQGRFGRRNADDPRQVAAGDAQGDALQLLRELRSSSARCAAAISPARSSAASSASALAPGAAPDDVALLVAGRGDPPVAASGLLVRFDVGLRILVDRRHAGEVARLEGREGDRELVAQREIGVAAKVGEALALLFAHVLAVRLVGAGDGREPGVAARARGERRRRRRRGSRCGP